MLSHLRKLMHDGSIYPWKGVRKFHGVLLGMMKQNELTLAIGPSFRNCAYNKLTSPPQHIPHTPHRPTPHAILHAQVIIQEHVPMTKIMLPIVAPGYPTSVPGVLGFVTGLVNTWSQPVTPSTTPLPHPTPPRNNGCHTLPPHVFRGVWHSTHAHWWLGSPAYALKCPWSCAHALGWPCALSPDL